MAGIMGDPAAMSESAAVGDGATDQVPEAPEAAGGFCIEIEVDGQGNLSVSYESGEQEAAERAATGGGEEGGTPAKSIEEALKIAKRLYYQYAAGGAAPEDMWNEEAAKRQPATATAGY